MRGAFVAGFACRGHSLLHLALAIAMCGSRADKLLRSLSETGVVIHTALSDEEVRHFKQR